MSLDKNEDYSKLDPILQVVHNNKVKLDHEEKKRAYILCQRVERVLKEKLNRSGLLLNAMTNGTTYQGSFFRGVKVKKPDEFDIDIQLKLPFKYNQIRLELREPGFVAINIKKAYAEGMKTPTWAQKYKGLEKFMDKKGFLVESQLRQELESVFFKVFSPGVFQLDLGDGIQGRCRMVKSGPAFTFCVDACNMKIDIDFVFGIYFEEIRPPKPVRKPDVPGMKGRFWLAVPKKSSLPISWRLSFPEEESFLLDGRQHLKFIYRLLKALRDEEKWSLASYHICTLFLWQSYQALLDRDDQFWHRSTGFLFIRMLTALKEALEVQRINFFWDSRNNMIEDKRPSNLANMSNRIGSHLRQIKKRYHDESLLQDYIFKDMFRMTLTTDEPKPESDTNFCIIS